MRKLLYIFIFFISSLQAQRPAMNPHPKEEVAYYNQIVVNSGSLTPVQRMAVSAMVSYWTSHALIDSIYCAFPMVGGTLKSCSYGLFSPSTYTLSFTNTVSGDFTSDGWQPNGVNSRSLINNFVMRTIITNSLSTGQHYISNTAVEPNVTPIDIGGRTSTAAQWESRIYASSMGGGVISSYNNTAGQGRFVGTNTVSIGDFYFVRESASIVKFYRDGVQIGTTGTTIGGAVPAVLPMIGAMNDAGTATNFCSKQCQGVSITYGIRRANLYYNSWNVLNTFLQR